MLRLSLLVTIVTSAFCLGAHAITPPPKASACTACHGPQGQGGNSIFPRLAGQPAAYIARQLEDFKRGIRKNPVMTSPGGGLSATDMRALASYFSTVDPPFSQRQAVAVTADALLQGRLLVTLGDWADGVPACVSCHGDDLSGVAPDVPALAGQPADYLAGALHRLQIAPGTTLASVTMRKVSRGLTDAEVSAVSAYIATLKEGERTQADRPAYDASYHPVVLSSDAFSPPPLNAIPTGPDGDAVWQGLQLMEHTRELASRYVGDNLNCVNCHVDQGRQAGSAPMWAAYVSYPKYRSKNRKVNTLEERIQGCFRFSMNGTPPATDSPEMTALVTYFHWLSTGLAVGITPNGAGYTRLAPAPQSPDPKRGARVYAADCAMCHGGSGQGRNAEGGEVVFPPLWGPRSFNWGAGMTTIGNTAAFIKANMPYGAGRKLGLQDAWDVAAFVDSRPRPQDPRFTGDVEKTRMLYHSNGSYYGLVVDGHLLGGPGMPEKN